MDLLKILQIVLEMCGSNGYDKDNMLENNKDKQMKNVKSNWECSPPKN